MSKKHSFFKFNSWAILIAFLGNGILPAPSYAQFLPQALNLPALGSLVTMSSGYIPPMIKGIKLDPENPFMFDFIVDVGDANLNADELKSESEKLVKYFMASLTMPEKDLWVNLNPDEPDRIIPVAFGQTAMGRDMLAQDYLLKQLTSSLLHPDTETGTEFWDRIYSLAGTYGGEATQKSISSEMMSKVWIVPDKAVVYEQKDRAFVVEASLKINYIETAKESMVGAGVSRLDQTEQLMREIILPEIEKEINEGEQFAQLRQVYNSLILATWFKMNFKNNVLNRAYSNQHKIDGIEINDRQSAQQIFDQYVASLKKGVCDMIKEEYDPATQEIIPRKYFLGGEELINVSEKIQEKSDYAMLTPLQKNNLPNGKTKNKEWTVTVNAVNSREGNEKVQAELMNNDQAMLSRQEKEDFKKVFPALDLNKALDISWREVVRNFATDVAPITQNQQNYFNNQIEVREEFIRLITNIATQKEDFTDDDFYVRLADIHKISMLGRSGTSYYLTDVMDDMGLTFQDVEEIAGTYLKPEKKGQGESKRQLIQKYLKEFIDLSQKEFSTEQVIKFVSLFYFDVMDESNGEWPFLYVNNSIFMNMANSMLEFHELNGIEHGKLDWILIDANLSPTKITTEQKYGLYFFQFMELFKKSNPNIDVSQINPFKESDQAMLASGSMGISGEELISVFKNEEMDLFKKRKYFEKQIGDLVEVVIKDHQIESPNFEMDRLKYVLKRTLRHGYENAIDAYMERYEKEGEGVESLEIILNIKDFKDSLQVELLNNGLGLNESADTYDKQKTRGVTRVGGMGAGMATMFNELETLHSDSTVEIVDRMKKYGDKEGAVLQIRIPKTVDVSSMDYAMLSNDQKKSLPSDSDKDAKQVLSFLKEYEKQIAEGEFEKDQEKVERYTKVNKYYRYMLDHSAVTDVAALKLMLSDPGKFLGLGELSNKVDAKNLLEDIIVRKYDTLQSLDSDQEDLSKLDLMPVVEQLKGAELLQYLDQNKLNSESDLREALQRLVSNEMTIMKQERWKELPLPVRVIAGDTDYVQVTATEILLNADILRAPPSVLKMVLVHALRLSSDQTPVNLQKRNNKIFSKTIKSFLQDPQLQKDWNQWVAYNEFRLFFGQNWMGSLDAVSSLLGDMSNINDYRPDELLKNFALSDIHNYIFESSKPSAAVRLDVAHDRVAGAVRKISDDHFYFGLYHQGSPYAAAINFHIDEVTQNGTEIITIDPDALYEMKAVYREGEKKKSTEEVNLYTGQEVQELGIGPLKPISPGQFAAYEFKKVSSNVETGDREYKKLLENSILRYRRYGPEKRIQNSFVTTEVKRILEIEDDATRRAEFSEVFQQLTDLIEVDRAIEIDVVTLIFSDLVKSNDNHRQKIVDELVHLIIAFRHNENMDSQKAVLASRLAMKVLRGQDVGEVVIAMPESLVSSGTGGLATYINDLAKEMADLGIPITVIVPMFADQKEKILEKFKPQDTGKTISVKFNKDGSETVVGKLWEARIIDENAVAGTGQPTSVRYVYIEQENYFNKLKAAGNNDPDAHRTAYNGTKRFRLRFMRMFSLGTLLAVQELNMHPSIIQTNDWTGAYAKAFWEGRDRIDSATHSLQSDDHLSQAKFVHVGHNLNVGYQGIVYTDNDQERDALLDNDLGLSAYQDSDVLFNTGDWSKINPTYTASKTSNHIRTVSYGYFQRSLDMFYNGEFGNLVGFLNWKNNVGGYDGSANGIDVVSRQKGLYGESFMELGSEAERKKLFEKINKEIFPQQKEKLQAAFGLEQDPDAYVYSMLHRIDKQKGFQLMAAHAWEWHQSDRLKTYITNWDLESEIEQVNEIEHVLTVEEKEKIEKFAFENHRGYLTAMEVSLLLNPKVQMIIAGSVDEGGHFDYNFKEAARLFPTQMRYVPAFINASDPRYELIYSGSDCFGMASLFEPGGLSNQEAAAYGSVRHLMLRDGIVDGAIEHNGFKEGFAPFNPMKWLLSFNKHYDTFMTDKELWNDVRYVAITQDNRWLNRAKNYIDLYRNVQGVDVVVELAELEIAGAIQRAYKQGDANAANELMTIGFTVEQAIDKMLSAVILTENNLFLNMILKEHLPELLKIENSSEYMIKHINDILKQPLNERQSKRLQVLLADIVEIVVQLNKRASESGDQIEVQGEIEEENMLQKEEGLEVFSTLKFDSDGKIITTNIEKNSKVEKGKALRFADALNTATEVVKKEDGLDFQKQASELDLVNNERWQIMNNIQSLLQNNAPLSQIALEPQLFHFGIAQLIQMGLPANYEIGILPKSDSQGTEEKGLTDEAMLSETKNNDEEVGGIDFNPTGIDLEIQKEGSGFEGFDVPLGEIPQIEGLIPIIINIVPLTNVNLLLGLETSNDLDVKILAKEIES